MRAGRKLGMQITRIFLALFLSLALLSVGCSGSSDSISKKDGSADGPCTITLSGNVTGTVSCTVAVLYDGQQKLTQFGLTVQQSEPTAGAFVKIAGTAQTGTFTDANCVECLVSRIRQNRKSLSNMGNAAEAHEAGVVFRDD